MISRAFYKSRSSRSLRDPVASHSDGSPVAPQIGKLSSQRAPRLEALAPPRPRVRVRVRVRVRKLMLLDDLLAELYKLEIHFGWDIHTREEIAYA